MSNYCYDCGREDDERTWWQQRPSWLRPIRWALRPWRRHIVRPLRAWWVAPAVQYAERLSDGYLTFDHCINTYTPRVIRGGIYEILGERQPWEYMDPNPMPAFRLWRPWRSLAAASPPSPPGPLLSFLPTFTAKREQITFLRREASTS